MPLKTRDVGVSRFTYEPGVRMPFGHRHREQEEVYVVVGGSGRVKLDNEIVEVDTWDAIRVDASVMRAFEAGPAGARPGVRGRATSPWGGHRARRSVLGMTDVDALVVGGGAAGLSAALVLGRARVEALVVDAGKPSNLHTAAIGGLLGHDGTSPAELYALGRDQLAAHPTVRLQTGTVTAIVQCEDGPSFTATLADGATVNARRVLLAGGMRYAVPDVPGLDALWGREAFACPYCHGWEHRDTRIALLGAEGLEHRVVLLRGWSADLVALPGGPLPAPAAAALREAGVPVDERPVASAEPGVVRFADGTNWPAMRSTSWPRCPHATTSRPSGACHAGPTERHRIRRRRHVRGDVAPPRLRCRRCLKWQQRRGGDRGREPRGHRPAPVFAVRVRQPVGERSSPGCGMSPPPLYNVEGT